MAKMNRAKDKSTLIRFILEALWTLYTAYYIFVVLTTKIINTLFGYYFAIFISYIAIVLLPLSIGSLKNIIFKMLKQGITKNNYTTELKIATKNFIIGTIVIALIHLFVGSIV
jgi:hypothetical protein